MPELWRVLVIVPAGSPLGQAASLCGWGCTAKLSANGTLPPTHYASCSVVNADELAELESVFAATGVLADAAYYRWEVGGQGGDGTLVSSWSDTPAGNPWSVAACCEDMGVRPVIIPPSAAFVITQQTPPAVAVTFAASLLAMIAAGKIQSQTGEKV